ncbi:hypothetical protein BKA66DRAFT_610409 [Pyrenochaeta sp. MPI-SDFR-AT-0127]|nr:hypothetical protein BKA66DRAFT_610409 [Pyrenochaeta sp. MPI-SDFR-AT-0127]
MVRGKTVLIGLRVLAVIVTLAVVGLGAWIKFIIHDIGIRGDGILDIISLESPIKDQDWRDYFTMVLSGVTRIWVSIATASFASLASILITLAIVIDRMRMSSTVLVPIECLSMCAMATAFGTSLSLAMSLNAFSNSRLDAVDSPELASFAMLMPLSKGYVLAAGIGWFLILVACIVATANACNRARAKESCSFEPTASALGMAHGYQAVIPNTPRDRVPTMYDPQRPLRAEPESPKSDEEKGFANEGSQMGRRDSGLSEIGKTSIDVGKEITGLLSLEKPQKVLQIRPSRPWSEVPRKKDDHVHAM